MKIILFFITLLLFNTSFSQNDNIITFNPEKIYSQQYIDSLISEIRSATTKKIEVSDFKKMLESNEKLTGWTYYYFGKSNVSYRKKDYDSAVYYANKGIVKFEDLKIKRPEDQLDLMLVYYYKAEALTNLRRYNQAIVNFQKALDISKIHPYKMATFFTAGIASNHFQLGNESLALKYYLETAKDSVFMSIPRASISSYIKIGDLYAQLKDIDKSKYYYREGLKVANNTDFKSNVFSMYGGLGRLFYMQKRLDSTLYYFKKAKKAKADYGSDYYFEVKENMIFEYYSSYVEVYEGSISKAITNLNKIKDSINSFEKITKTDEGLMLSIIELLGIAYQKQNNSKEYETLLNESISFMSRLHEQQLKENLDDLEIQYQTKVKDESILQLEKNKVQQNIIIEQQRAISFGLGGFLIVLSGFGYLFWRQRKLRTQYEKENLEQRLLRSQMNPHFIGNAMNTVSALVEKKAEHTIPYINKLSNLFRLVLTNSREEFVSLEDEIVTMKSYLELQSNFSTNFDFSFSIDENIDKEAVVIPPMLIQPFIENAIIHGLTNAEHRGRIEVSISKKEKEGLLFFKIKDNGVGYKESFKLKTRKDHKSVSGDIIAERLKLLKKKFKVNTRFFITEEDSGTSVALYLPYLLDD